MWFALYNNMFGEPINCTVFISLLLKLCCIAELPEVFKECLRPPCAPAIACAALAPDGLSIKAAQSSAEIVANPQRSQLQSYISEK